MKQLSNINTKYLMFWLRGNIKNLIFTRSLHCCCSCTGFVRDIDYCLARPIHLEKPKNTNKSKTNRKTKLVCKRMTEKFRILIFRMVRFHLSSLWLVIEYRDKPTDIAINYDLPCLALLFLWFMASVFKALGVVGRPLRVIALLVFVEKIAF